MKTLTAVLPAASRAGKGGETARQYNFNMQYQSTRTNSENHAMIARGIRSLRSQEDDYR